ncbi:MAG: helix-turn-helix domain-containing protein [Clostridia bacterium]|nr:helix-turn-helix domain-containing protein [Clostridia bacterium]
MTLVSSEFDKTKFSSGLKNLLTKHKVKQIDLAAYLGVSKSTISNYLSGLSYPRMETLQKIASYFGTTVDYFIKEKNDTTLSEGKIDSVQSVPLLSNQGDSIDNIFNSKNFKGHLSLPFYAEKNSQCYAIKISDNDMKNYNLPKGSVVVFAKDKDAKVGDLTAVYLKDTKKIVARHTSKKGKETLLLSDSSSCKIQDKNIKILGKIVLVMSMF